MQASAPKRCASRYAWLKRATSGYGAAPVLHCRGRRHCVTTVQPASPVEPDHTTQQFYRDAMRALDDAELPYVVGGGYAMAFYTGIQRNTKDLDVFMKPEDHKRALEVLEKAG